MAWLLPSSESLLAEAGASKIDSCNAFVMIKESNRHDDLRKVGDPFSDSRIEFKGGLDTACKGTVCWVDVCTERAVGASISELVRGKDQAPS